MTTPCPCGSSKALENCCQPVIDGERIAPTPEALMRSRYTAFCQKNIEYLKKSTHPSALKDFDHAATLAWATQASFKRLEILKSSQNGDDGFVSFRAHYLIRFQPQVHQEDSEFKKEGGIWYFYQGQ